VEEWLLFDRVALHSAGVPPRNVQGSTSVVANFADARLALWNWTTVTTGKTAYAIAVKFLVEIALADVFVNDIPQARHTTQPDQRLETTFYCNGASLR
jgi:hypothetical protein